MTTECETKTEQKLTRTQWALFFFAVLSAFFGGLFVQAVLSPLPSSSGATYDITARNDAAQALREVESLRETVRRDEEQSERVRRDLESHLRRPIGLPAGQPVGAPVPVPQREGS
jgi:hypothetical protein